MGRVKGSGEGSGREKRIFFLPSPSPLSFFRPSTYPQGYYFYSPQSFTVIKSKMAATTIRTRTRFRPPKILIADQNEQNLYGSFSDRNITRTIPFGAAHTYIAYIKENPPPPPLLEYLSLLTMYLLLTLRIRLSARH